VYHRTVTFELAKALFVLGRLRGEVLLELAMTLLESGADTPAVRDLAGMIRPTVRDARSPFLQMLTELGHALPAMDAAKWTIAKDLAHSVLAGAVSPRDAAADLAGFADRCDYQPAFMPFYDALEEYECCTQRGYDEVDRDVIASCRALLDEASGPAHDAARLVEDPTFRMLASRERRETSVALTSTLHWFETDTLTKERNYQGLTRLNTALIQHGSAQVTNRRAVLDIDSSESPVHGAQEQSAYNGHFESICYHTLFVCLRCSRLLPESHEVNWVESGMDPVNDADDQVDLPAVRMLRMRREAL
jgi:hypothetical protein